jgi:hypothetical protein
MALIEARGVSFGYNGTPLFRDINFSIEPGLLTSAGWLVLCQLHPPARPVRANSNIKLKVKIMFFRCVFIMFSSPVLIHA